MIATNKKLLILSIFMIFGCAPLEEIKFISTNSYPVMAVGNRISASGFLISSLERLQMFKSKADFENFISNGSTDNCINLSPSSLEIMSEMTSKSNKEVDLTGYIAPYDPEMVATGSCTGEVLVVERVSVR